MPNEEQSKPWQRKVALLVVHGMGDQVEGYTRQKVIDGLVSVYGDDINDGPDGNGVVTLRLPMKGGWCRVRLYEVYWAKMLKGSERGSFDLGGLGAVAWYPHINLIDGRYPSGHRKSLRVWLWTLFLVPLGVLFWSGHTGWTAITNSLRRNRSDQRSWVDRELDKSVGDVFTYVKSMRGAIAVNSPRFDAAEKILSHFHATLKKADNDPLVDEIQVLAHSLGTVIAFHGLTGQQPATAAKVIDEEERPIVKTHKPVTALLTIGAPLMKIMFFWPELVAEDMPFDSATGAHFSMPPWTNFYNWLDSVSGRLRRLSPQIKSDKDQRIWAGGAVTSHTIYETNKTFLEHLTRSLTGAGAKPHVHWWKVAWQVIWSPIETFGALIIFPFVVFIGAAYLAIFLAVLPRFVGLAIEKVGLTTVGMLLSDWGPPGILSLVFVWLIWKNRLLAKTQRGATAAAIVLNDHIPLFLKAASEAVPEEFGETQMEKVTRMLLDKRRSGLTFPGKSGEKRGPLDLNVQSVGDNFVFTFSGDKRVVESVRSAFRATWKRLLSDEARELGK